MSTRTDFPKKAPKVALLSSTRAVLAPMEAAFHAEFPEAQMVNLLDETLLTDFAEAGGLSPRSRRKALQMALAAQDAGVDGILVTCSTLSSCVDDFLPFVIIPMIKIDEPLVDLVLPSAESIGLLATADSVLRSVEPLVLGKARLLGREISVQRFVRDDLWPLATEDLPAFHRAVGEAATEAARVCQAVIITQVSMSPGLEYVETSVRERVYILPVYAVRAIRRLLEGCHALK